MMTARNEIGQRAIESDAIDGIDILVIERRPNRGYAIRAREGRLLATVPPAARSETGPWMTIKPWGGAPVHLRRERGLVGETVQVESAAGAWIAEVEWRALRRGFRYRVRLSDRELWLDGRDGGDFEMDISAERATIGTLLCELSPLVVRRVIRLEPGQQTPELRWALLAAALLVDSKPSLFNRPAPTSGVDEPWAA